MPAARLETDNVSCVCAGASVFGASAQKKFLVPADLTIGQFVYVIRKVRRAAIPSHARRPAPPVR